MISKAVHTYLSQIGQRGGQAGTGEAKRRDVAFYRRISRKGLRVRRAKARQAKSTQS
jgi:hypothetical protein